MLRRPRLRASSPSQKRTLRLENNPEPPFSVMIGLASKTRQLSIGPVSEDSSPRLPILSRHAARPAERPRRRICSAPQPAQLRVGFRIQLFQCVGSTEAVPVFRTARTGPHRAGSPLGLARAACATFLFAGASRMARADSGWISTQQSSPAHSAPRFTTLIAGIRLRRAR